MERPEPLTEPPYLKGLKLRKELLHTRGRPVSWIHVRAIGTRPLRVSKALWEHNVMDNSLDKYLEFLHSNGPEYSLGRCLESLHSNGPEYSQPIAAV